MKAVYKFKFFIFLGSTSIACGKKPIYLFSRLSPVVDLSFNFGHENKFKVFSLNFCLTVFSNLKRYRKYFRNFYMYKTFNRRIQDRRPSSFVEALNLEVIVIMRLMWSRGHDQMVSKSRGLKGSNLYGCISTALLLVSWHGVEMEYDMTASLSLSSLPTPNAV